MDSRRVESSVAAIVVCMFENELKYVEKAIDSVLAQTVSCQLIVVAGVSVAPRLRHMYPQHVAGILETEPVRLGEARNIGISLANRCTWVAFLDSDDSWRTDKIEIQLNAAAKKPDAVLIGSCARLVSESGVPFAHTTSLHIPLPSTWMLRYDFFNSHKFDAKAVPEDGPWWIANIDSGHAESAIRVGLSLIDYCVRDNSLSSNMPGKERKTLLHRAAFEWKGREVILIGTWFLQWCFRPSKRFKKDPHWRLSEGPV